MEVGVSSKVFLFSDLNSIFGELLFSGPLGADSPSRVVLSQPAFSFGGRLSLLKSSTILGNTAFLRGPGQVVVPGTPQVLASSTFLVFGTVDLTCGVAECGIFLSGGSLLNVSVPLGNVNNQFDVTSLTLTNSFARVSGSQRLFSVSTSMSVSQSSSVFFVDACPTFISQLEVTAKSSVFFSPLACQAVPQSMSINSLVVSSSSVLQANASSTSLAVGPVSITDSFMVAGMPMNVGILTVEDSLLECRNQLRASIMTFSSTDVRGLLSSSPCRLESVSNVSLSGSVSFFGHVSSLVSSFLLSEGTAPTVLNVDEFVVLNTSSVLCLGSFRIRSLPSVSVCLFFRLFFRLFL